MSRGTTSVPGRQSLKADDVKGVLSPAKQLKADDDRSQYHSTHALHMQAIPLMTGMLRSSFLVK